VNPGLHVQDGALDYVQTQILLKLVRILISGKPKPRTGLEVEKIVEKTFPHPIDDQCLKRVHAIMGHLGLTGGTTKKINTKKLSNSKTFFPLQEFHAMLKDVLADKTVEIHMTIAIIGVIEHIAEEVFKMAGIYVNNLEHDSISEEDARIAIHADRVLMDLLRPQDNSDDKEHEGTIEQRKSHSQMIPNPSFDHSNEDNTFVQSLVNNKESLQLLQDSICHVDSSYTQPSYENVVKELIKEEKAFLRDISLIIKVFKDTFVELLIKESGSNSGSNSLPSSPISPTSPSGQWSLPSSPTHKTGDKSKITSADIDAIFSNISDIEENTLNLLCGLEDALEAMSFEDPVTSTDRSPKSGIESIGACFEELAETAEFDVFLTFAEDVLTYRVSGYSSSNLSTASSNIVMSRSTERLNQLLSYTWITNTLSTGGQGFLPAVKYVLPKLLNGVVYHSFSYFKYISILKKLSPSEEDRESFRQAEGLLAPLKSQLERMTNKKPGKFGQDFLCLASLDGSSSDKTAGEKAKTLTKYLDGIDSNMYPFLNKFLHEGTVTKQSKTSSDRQALLFDGALLLCKPVVSKKCSSLVAIISSKDHHPQPGKDHFEYRIKEKFLVNSIDVIDLPDTVIDGLCTDPSCPEQHGLTGTVSRSSHMHSTVMNQLQNQLKMMSTASWGTSTISITSSINSAGIGGTQGGSASANLPANIRLVNAFELRMNEPPGCTDSVIVCCQTPEDKITWMSLMIFLSNKSLLERRLKNAVDEEIKRTPLQTPNPEVYNFTQQDCEQNIIFEENKFSNSGAPLIRGATLLKLIERLTYHQYADPAFVKIFLTTYRSFCSPQELLHHLIERFKIPDIESKSREDLRRFEKGYVKPVQLRVLNVMRSWVEHHYYDFARDPELEAQMIKFLEESIVVKRNLKAFVNTIHKSITKKRDFRDKEVRPEVFTFQAPPPPFEHWLAKSPEEFNILTIHPIEFARQLTLHEFDLFKRVQPSELVLCAWTKKDKEKASPNLLKMIHFTNNFIYYLEQQILETMNIEERTAVYSRIIEIMLVLKELNNLNGVLEIVSAMNSSPVFRLLSTKQRIPDKLKAALEEASDLNSDHYLKYQELLRSINPPCVPFLGMYLTQIVHIEEGNPDDITVFLDQASQGPSAANSLCASPSLSSTSAPTSTCVSPCVLDTGLTTPKETSSVSLINFSKRRKVAEITEEIRTYQNTRYNLDIHKDIRHFISNIDPLKELQDVIHTPLAEESASCSPITCCWDKETTNKVIDYFYNKSLEVEPRNQPRPKFDRKWPDLNLKSPGIKPTNIGANSQTIRRGQTPFSTNSLNSSSTSTITPSIDSQAQLSPTSIILEHPMTGTNPSTPLTPTPLSGGSASDRSVFASVMIGGITGFSGHCGPPTPTTPGLGFPFLASVAPPLPPKTTRIHRGISSDSDSPPPLPPKGTSPSQKGLTHYHHGYQQPTPPVGVAASSPACSLVHPNHHPLHFPFQRNNSFSSTSPGSLGLIHHHRHGSSPSSHHSNSPSFSHGVQPIQNPHHHVCPQMRRNSAMDIPLAPAPAPRRHSSTTSTTPTTTGAPPLHPPPPPPPPPLTEERDELPQLPPRTYKLGQNSFSIKYSPE